MNASSSAKNKTADQWLKAATQQLTAAGIATARLDCMVLLEDVLNTNRTQLLAHPEQILSHEQTSELFNKVERRAAHEPLAYIRGKTEFYGREFAVSPAVLEPRPETETMVDLAKKLVTGPPRTVIDVGTGSGAIAITMAIELSEVLVYATDIDPTCLKVARRNATKHQTTVNFKQTNLIEGLELPEGSLVLANLPYVPDDHQINQAAMNEPRLAIFGGTDGLDLYRELFSQLAEQAHRPQYVLTESLPFQHEALADIAKQHAYRVLQTVDFIQVFTL